MVGEEIIKQNIDPIRDDSYVPFVAAYGYTVPSLFSKLSAVPGLKTQKKVKEYDDEYIANTIPKQTIKDQDIGIDGTFVNPNKTDPDPKNNS